MIIQLNYTFYLEIEMYLGCSVIFLSVSIYVFDIKFDDNFILIECIFELKVFVGIVHFISFLLLIHEFIDKFTKQILSIKKRIHPLNCKCLYPNFCVNHFIDNHYLFSY